MNKQVEENIDKAERSGYNIFLTAIKLQIDLMAAQFGKGQDINPDSKITRRAFIEHHMRWQLIAAKWQFAELQKGQTQKASGLAVYTDTYDDLILQLIEQGISPFLAKMITRVDETTKEQVRQIIEQGRTDGIGIPEIAKRIMEYKRDDFNKVRAIMIARTESTRAASLGHKTAAMAWEQAIGNGEKSYKWWSAASDNRTRKDHLHMVNFPQIIPASQRFIVGREEMDFPGDPNASARNTINCRCRAVYMSERVAKKRIARLEQEGYKVNDAINR